MVSPPGVPMDGPTSSGGLPPSSRTNSAFSEHITNSKRTRYKSDWLKTAIEVLCVLTVASAADALKEGLVLSPHIRHYEPVFYDSDHFSREHHRAKRDVDAEVTLRFHAHNRLFHLRLTRDTSIFHDEVVFESTDGAVAFDTHKIYSGKLLDDDLSDVSGVVTSGGLFDGHIVTSNELYYLEPADRYLTSPEFHSVMYKASDVIHPDAPPGGCASQQLHDHGGLKAFPPLLDRNINPKLLLNRNNRNKFSTSDNQLIKTRLKDQGGGGANQTTGGGALPLKNRGKRSAIDPQKTTCMLYLQADHLFYEKIGSEEACIDSITRHVQRVNSIYKVTDFDRDGESDDIKFMIKRIKIHNQNALSEPGYRFPNNYGVEKFLELFSEEDYDSFCLAYMFTYRDFEGGTLGLAWTGDLKNAGGVCEKNGHYRGSLKSLNTGIVTLLNYGKHVPPAVSHVTLAHEIGHNFGSPHDPEQDTVCTPGGEDGNYIMFARATSGDKLNNNKFSPCSLQKINKVLNSKARDDHGCFTIPQASICGNGVVEKGEQCDCGWEDDCSDQCCFPMTSTPRRGEDPCTLRHAKTCSPSQGPCCTHQCTLKIGDKCRDNNGCRDTAFCDGMGPECPPSVNKPNKTICNNEFVCYRGECTGSICLAYGLESCQCKRNSGDPETKSCELCCKKPGEDQPCLSSFDWNVFPYNIPDMYAKAGTPCDDYKGYCDVFKKCREVDPYGPLATLRKLLLSDESLASLNEWIKHHWWAVTLLLIAMMVLLVAVVRLFGRKAVGTLSRRRHKHKHRKKKKKKKTVHHKNTQGINGSYPEVTASPSGATAEGATHVVHPTVIRANLPFKRKVNEVKRAATKAKRAAKSTLSRPHKKMGVKKTVEAKRVSSRRVKEKASPLPSTPEAGTPQTENNDLVNTVATLNGNTVHHAVVTAAIPSTSKNQAAAGVKPKKKPSSNSKLSSRFSVLSFNSPFKSKSQSPSRYKITITDKRKAAKVAAKNSKRTRSPSKRDSRPEAVEVKAGKSRSPSKRATMDDDRRKPKSKGFLGSDKLRRQTLPNSDVSKYRFNFIGKKKPANDGSSWLIQKFLADEQKIAKPVFGEDSLEGSVTSMNALINGSGNASPNLSYNRHGSTRALLPDPAMGSPVRGIINEAFISSPRGARTHASLRVTKSTSPVDDSLAVPNSYLRSVSMDAYKQSSPSKKVKRGDMIGMSEEKLYPSIREKPVKNFVPRPYEFGENMAPPLPQRNANMSPLSSTHSTVERGSSKLLSSSSGMEPTEILETASLHSNKQTLETGSMSSSSKGLHDTGSLHSSNSRTGSSKGLRDSSSLHSSKKSLLADSNSHNSKENITITIDSPNS